ncbi:tRNA (5-methylaminomethyl-2-thiouridine)(34)-methyltransferase MnmD [Spirosoma sp. KUDC1026]|uniref:tRNA (5-methylaminomethyl-2-thiouridine)(34)-methyltransferase MnmD n=1 Tax=Spirosoma sp. KUDC1026 TaxID=2745947 RepID=UPI00159B9A38|nr:tRNA (5-methylaminomethyl-2-thiouridine)(34)-methyltransferase MnmD [Spirosoma sp. KUDC1026]QKZ11982.1 tRNA (5-methylaminomethyl-2-thiouridine)(34)-methyltransferase MnmD [Spirosoma sp. KUDC1026]
MKAALRIVTTEDGSSTVINETFDKSYHSVYGAQQESQRVYIELGLLAALEKFPNTDLFVFEMGFGTGLNALMTALEADNYQRKIHYTAVEAQPLLAEEARQLNYDTLLGTNYLEKLHMSPWNEPVEISPYFSLTKWEGRLQDFRTSQRFHLIYYDAFAPTSQPELWEEPVFQQMTNMLLPEGLLTTYCSRSYVQRNMQAAGLIVEKHPGPPHKREILRAVKSA